MYNTTCSQSLEDEIEVTQRHLKASKTQLKHFKGLVTQRNYYSPDEVANGILLGIGIATNDIWRLKTQLKEQYKRLDKKGKK